MAIAAVLPARSGLYEGQSKGAPGPGSAAGEAERAGRPLSRAVDGLVRVAATTGEPAWAEALGALHRLGPAGLNCLAAALGRAGADAARHRLMMPLATLGGDSGTPAILALLMHVREGDGEDDRRVLVACLDAIGRGMDRQTGRATIRPSAARDEMS